MASSYPIVTLVGPRQSGKTTLVKELFTDKPYVSLENPDERSLAETDPRAFLERFPQGAILDGIQRLPILLSYLQEIVDQQDQKGMFILTGSHQLALHESISQSLAGRTAILTLLPFSLAELPDVAFSLDDYLLHGMYPRIYKDNINPTKFYRDYVQTYIERDVRQMINLKDLAVFQQFLKLCAGRTGQILNGHSLSNELGISYPTVKHWLSILEASFLIFRLQPYFENLGKRIIKSPKLYFTDVGLAAYLLDIHSTSQLARDPLRGNLVENLVIADFFKNCFNQGLQPGCYYYRDSNHREVDLLFKTGHYLVPIEIKAAKTFNSGFLKSLKYFKDLVKERCQQGFVIYAGDQQQRIESFHVVNYKHIATVLKMLTR